MCNHDYTTQSLVLGLHISDKMKYSSTIILNYFGNSRIIIGYYNQFHFFANTLSNAANTIKN